MNKGKATCYTLKQIRKQIADANGIDYSPTPCTFEGDCSGTCPRCESEVRFIERKLNELQRQGRKIIVTGLAAGMIAVGSGSSAILSSCSSRHITGIVPNPNYTEQPNDTTEINEVLEGDISIEDPDFEIEILEVVEEE